MSNPLKPLPSLLCKLGSIAVHADEMFSKDGHAFDKIELQNRLADAEVIEWLEEMGKLAMIPLKRTAPGIPALGEPSAVQLANRFSDLEVHLPTRKKRKKGK